MNQYLVFTLYIWLGTGALVVLNNFANVLKGRSK